MNSAGTFGVLSLVAAISCAAHDARTPGPPAAAHQVVVATAHHEPLPVVYRVSGTVRGRTTTVLTSKTTGYVRAVQVRPGDTVTAGQPLVELEANDVLASVQRARALLDQSFEAKAEAENALQSARVAARLAKASYDRAELLLKQQAIPQQDFDEAEARHLGAAAQQEVAQARLRSVASRIAEAKAGVFGASTALGYAHLTAPFAGRVLERRVDPGALATPGTPLLVLTDEGTLRVEAAVEESRTGSVHVGDPAEVALDASERPLTARIAEIVPSVDVASRAFLVKLDLPPEAAGARAGSFARVTLREGIRPRLVVPTTAVTSLGALDRVFVVDGDAARLRMLSLGERRGEWTEVLAGLSDGERVVVAPSPELRDGARVVVQP